MPPIRRETGQNTFLVVGKLDFILRNRLSVEEPQGTEGMSGYRAAPPLEISIHPVSNTSR